jgi:hypothetical protein
VKNSGDPPSKTRPVPYRHPAVIAIAVLLCSVVGHRVVLQLWPANVFIRERAPIPAAYSNFLVGPMLSGVTNSALTNYSRQVPYKAAQSKKVSPSDLREIRCKLSWCFLWPPRIASLEVVDPNQVVARSARHGFQVREFTLIRQASGWEITDINTLLQE